MRLQNSTNRSSAARLLAGRVFAAGAAAVVIAVPAAAQGGTPSTASRLVIRGATIVDPATGRKTSGEAIVIDGDRIVAVAPSPAVPRDARVVDATGKFVIPGLWDMHVHATGPALDRLFLPVLAANGITGVREMFGRVQWYDSARALARRGEIVAPRLVGSGHILDGTPAIWPGSVVVSGAERTRRAVDSLVDAGAAFIKVYSRLTREEFQAAATQARHRGVPFAGHVPSLIPVGEAVDAGIHSIEHLQQFTTSCSSAEAEVGARYAAAVASPKGWDSAGVIGRGATRQILDGYDARRCEALAAQIKARGTWMVPTLTVLRSIAYLDDSTLAADPRLAYIPRWFSTMWNPRNDFRFRMLTPEDWATRKAVYAQQERITQLLHRAGVSFLAGTDLSNPYIYPGFSLHDELEHFVRLGFTPLEALQTATINPARYFGATDSLGTVAVGKLADLVVLDADPLADIRNTTRISAVVAGGRLLDAATRDSLLAGARRRAGGGG